LALALVIFFVGMAVATGVVAVNDRPFGADRLLRMELEQTIPIVLPKTPNPRRRCNCGVPQLRSDGRFPANFGIAWRRFLGGA
jgi:hypothetical protein